MVGLALLMAVALPALPGCSGGGKKNQRSAPPPVAVTADTARVEDVPMILRAVGTVEPQQSVAVSARVGGQLLRVGFAEGDDVRPGDLLFEIDPRPWRAALDAAEADMARDRARAVSAEADARRYAELVEQDFVTRQQADQMQAAALAARATVRADSAAVESARLNLGYCQIRSPLRGRTGSLLVHAGNLVRANDTSPMVVINQIVPTLVRFSVPERHLSEIRDRSAAGALAVMARLPGDSGPELPGELTFIDNEVDARTGTVPLKATFPNEDRALWPGQFVDVTLHLGMQTGAVVIPTAAVQPGQNGDVVFVIRPDDTVEPRAVTIARQLGGRAVVAGGVAAGERIVIDGQLRLSPGARVRLKPPVGSAEPGRGGPAGEGAASGPDSHRASGSDGAPRHP